MPPSLRRKDYPTSRTGIRSSSPEQSWHKRSQGFQQWLFNIALALMAVLAAGFIISALTTRDGTLITIDREEAAQRAQLLAMSAERDRAPDSDGRTVLEILNGVGLPGLAEDFSDYLRNEGFDVLRFTNAQRYDYPRTIVINRGKDLQKAQLVAQSLGLAPSDVENIPDPEVQLDVTIVLGADYATLPS